MKVARREILGDLDSLFDHLGGRVDVLNQGAGDLGSGAERKRDFHHAHTLVEEAQHFAALLLHDSLGKLVVKVFFKARQVELVSVRLEDQHCGKEAHFWLHLTIHVHHLLEDEGT